MDRFFGFAAFLCSAGLIYAMGVGYGLFPLAGVSSHLLIGLLAAILSVALHCLIFAIFTGSGKDTRLLVEDLGLNSAFVARTKRFKKEVFPPALYAILAILILISLGGALSVLGTAGWVRWIHGILAWFVVAYNLWTFWREYQAVKENSQLLQEINSVASQTLKESPSVLGSAEDPYDPSHLTDSEWGRHGFAMGKFLCFLAYNLWLAYFYMRIIMNWYWLALWPFILASVLLWAVGYLLRLRFAKFRPQLTAP